MWACYFIRIEAVKILLDHRADVSIKNKVVNELNVICVYQKSCIFDHLGKTNSSFDCLCEGCIRDSEAVS
jgi:ankyrin repeat protein